MSSTREGTMLSRRQRQLLARKEPHFWQEEVKRKKILEKIEEQAKNTDNLLARLRARIEVLDLVVDKTLPEESFLARKELNPWKFRRNERLHNKWTFINSVVTLQEFLVAATDAKTRRDEAEARPLQTDLQHSSPTPGKKTSCSEGQSALNTPSLSRTHSQEADKERRINITADSTQPLPKEAITVRNQYNSNQQTAPEASSISHYVSNSDTPLPRGAVESIQIKEVSLPKEKIHDTCPCSRIRDNDEALPDTMTHDSTVTPEASTKVVQVTSSKTKQPSITAFPVNDNSGINKEFLQLDNKFNRSQTKQKCRPSLKPGSFSKYEATARDFEKNMTFGWISQPDAEICQYCKKSVCMGQRFKIYLAGKGKPDIRPPQSQLSVRMKRRIADITAIYGFVYG